MKNRLCKYCGDEFKPNRHNQLFCKNECRLESAKLKSHGLSGVKGDGRLCAWCGEKHNDTRKKYCGDPCRAKALSLGINSKRRARLNSVPRLNFDLIDVIKRDGIDCNYCGVKTTDSNRDMETHINIDHIIPLSKGGHHALYNAQILCRVCNIKKGNKIYDVDLARAKEQWPSNPAEFIRSSKGAGLRRDNKSGVKGVFFSAGIDKWIARIESNKRKITLIQTGCKDTAIKYRNCAGELKKSGIPFEEIKEKCRELMNATS